MSQIKHYDAIYTPEHPEPLLATRSTFVALKCGHNILISPLLFSESQLGELKNRPIHALVAPNCFHHLYIKKACEQLQVSHIYAPAPLHKKRSDIDWTVTLDEKTWPYHEEMPMVLLEGAAILSECVFFHKASRTLIVTDLFFNLKNKTGLKAQFLHLTGTYNRPAVSRLLALFVQDKKAFSASLERIFAFDFDRLIMAHGEVIETGAKTILRAALKERGLI